MERGFTLLELLATLAVGALAAMLATPSLTQLAARHRTTVALHEVTSALATARLEAVRRNVPVVVCPSNDGATCRSDLRWDAGWLVFVDPVRAGQPVGPNAVLRRFEGLPRQRMQGTAGRPLVRFTADGWSAGSNATLTLCDDRGITARVIVNNAGRARTERPARPERCPF